MWYSTLWIQSKGFIWIIQFEMTWILDIYSILNVEVSYKCKSRFLAMIILDNLYLVIFETKEKNPI